LKLQELFFPCQRGVFVVTSVLNGISLFCLLKKTPPNQFGVRVYLIAVQEVIIILSSVYLDVLYAPIPVFPALACYCAGHLCMAGWSPHVVVMNRSPASIKRQRKSLIVLFVQIAVPLIMIIVPAFTLFTSLA
ncbi:hypothetical protein PMAYCL1PPCAC_13709, partial [Pristionchus mayeri]